ncbi:extracellular receptor [Strigomonas culicis]|uniref:Extracellular receptor n=1 Tax=Strigomonas culicis TaxID=28005 RepID=S9W2V3_9TRYP|nr:extracellular receptor [Strigomonas culicis]|eukprot:EPY33656.1 extracellular receptor [Strigomonas culicis]
MLKNMSLKQALAACLVALLLCLVGAPGVDAAALKWAVLIDLTRSSLNVTTFTQGIQHYITTNTSFAAVNGSTYFAESPTILNSDGDFITALQLVSDLVSNKSALPDVLFLGETTDISIAVSDFLRTDTTTANILLVSIHGSNSRLCDPSTNTRTVCIVPRDLLNLRGLLETTSAQLQWSSVAVVYSNSGYGDGVKSALAGQIQAASTTPTVVAEATMNPAGTDDEDDTLVAALLKYKPKGIACFVRESQMNRLRSALVRANASDVFLMGSRECLNVLPNLTGTYSPLTAAWGAIYASKYYAVEDFVAGGYFPTDDLDPYGAFIISHLLDGMYMISAAGGTSSMTALRATSFRGFSGDVAFDSIYYQRVEMTYAVTTASYGVDAPLVTWYLKDYSSTAVQTNTKAAITAALITDSPLRAVKVCMTSAPSCGDTELMWSMLYVLAKYNSELESSSSSIPFITQAINTGASGVSGLSSLIPVARTCSVIAGPGRSSIAVALTPVINEFAVAQLDYASANDFFTDEEYSYPYFSRSVPQNSFNFLAYGDLCAWYAWERVIIVSMNDAYGITRASSLSSSMKRNNIYVEKTYYLDDLGASTITTVLDTIYKTDVSRIIFMMISGTEAGASTFFNLADSLSYMSKYVFFLSKDLCAYGDTSPSARKKLVSSICMFPYVSSSRLTSLNTAFASDTTVQSTMKLTLSDGGFVSQLAKCSLSTIRAQNGFAVDAGYALIDVVDRMVTAGASFNVSANIKKYIRSTTINKFTSNFSIDSTGNRDFAAYNFDIQTPTDVVTFALWSQKQTPNFQATVDDFTWLTGSTTVPLDTFRDMSFVLSSSFTASPGTIVLTVLGFVGTIMVFFFCYRHYKMQKLIEHALLSSEIPVTDEELRRLRGEVDPVE